MVSSALGHGVTGMTTTTDMSPLDEGILDELRAAMSDESFDELAGTFLEQLRAVGDRFVLAAAVNDRRKAEHAAHELAGLAGTMGAVRLASTSRDAMARCRTPDADLGAVSAVIQRDAASASAAFEAYVRRNDR